MDDALSFHRLALPAPLSSCSICRRCSVAGWEVAPAIKLCSVIHRFSGSGDVVVDAALQLC